MDVEPGRCIICPVFGRDCNYGLECETDPLVLSQTTSMSKKHQTRPHSQHNPNPMRQIQQPPHQSRLQHQGNFAGSSAQPYNQQYGHAMPNQPYYIPVIPLMQMIPTESLQGSQVYINMQMPVLEMMRPRLANSTMVPSETFIPYRSQVNDLNNARNPEAPSP